MNKKQAHLVRTFLVFALAFTVNGCSVLMVQMTATYEPSVLRKPNPREKVISKLGPPWFSAIHSPQVPPEILCRLPDGTTTNRPTIGYDSFLAKGLRDRQTDDGVVSYMAMADGSCLLLPEPLMTVGAIRYIRAENRRTRNVVVWYDLTTNVACWRITTMP